ncbi:hypothetical protein [Herbaspirillum huttiense]|uniref:hypothetical protein n=1 Tax=Herbaspirillum huttiense TaxID=863372 RepID=UPI003CF5FE10
MNENLAQQNNQTIGTVTALSFSYSAASGALVVRKTAGAPARVLTGNEVKSILEAIKIKNTAGSIASDERLVAQVALFDIATKSSTASSITMNIFDTQPMLDMDSTLPGIQHQARLRYQPSITTTPLVTDITATSSASEIRITNNWPPYVSSEYMDVDNGAGVSTRFVVSTNTPFVGTVGGVNNVRINVNSTSTLMNIVRESGTEFSASEIQAVIKALKFGTSYNHLYRFDFSLVKNGVVGPVSSIDLATNPSALTLDLDTTVAGNQAVSTRSIGSVGQSEGASLFSKPIAASGGDTRSIQLSFSGAFSLAEDKLLLGAYTLDFNTSTPVNQVLSLSGVRDVAISYNRASGFSGAAPLVLSKSTGTTPAHHPPEDGHQPERLRPRPEHCAQSHLPDRTRPLRSRRQAAAPHARTVRHRYHLAAQRPKCSHDHQPAQARNRRAGGGLPARRCQWQSLPCLYGELSGGGHGETGSPVPIKKIGSR